VRFYEAKIANSLPNPNREFFRRNREMSGQNRDRIRRSESGRKYVRFTPNADMCVALAYVRFGPIADMAVLIVSTTRAAAARRPTGIVKLIRHAKSTDAAHGCPALLNGEEAAICSSPSSARILRAPSSIIAGQRIHWRLRQHHCQHNECRYLSHEAHCSLLVVTRNWLCNHIHGNGMCSQIVTTRQPPDAAPPPASSGGRRRPSAAPPVPSVNGLQDTELQR